MLSPFIREKLLAEISLHTTLSGGKGGQHVNKVATRVELYFNVMQSEALNEEQKLSVMHRLRNRISGQNVLRITDAGSRSQLKNRDAVREKFLKLIERAITPRTQRKPTNPTTQSRQERLRNKKMQSRKKDLRRNDDQHLETE